MDCDENDNSSNNVTALGDDEHRNAVNSVILDYYKKIGRKRDLEQYFSLSTANSELRDPTGTFWRKMKSENDSSDSGEKTNENTAQEVCRISIRCSVPDPCSSQDEDPKTKSESVSPPIITEVSPESGHNSDAESVKSGSVKSEDNQSQKSYDVLLDTSLNKPFSPTSSITSQRKLEWDSLADVGYANESDRKTSASSLSTLERLALIQQYSNNDNQSTIIGVPTAHSTPLDENEPKSKTKKGIGKKSTKIYQKDVDFVEVNVPEYSNNPTQAINVNLTKHISFNVEKDGKVTIENIQKDVSVSPEKTPVESVVPPKYTFDKEIQTTLVKTKEANVSTKSFDSQSTKIPVMISLNTLRKRTRRKQIMAIRKKLKQKKSKESLAVQEKSGEQLSEAESFEYMPGHIYNQNQLQAKEQITKERPSNAVGNKSSLESSGVLTTDSSKSMHSFSMDLERSIELLKNALKDRDDANLRKQLVKQICKRLINTKYRDEDSTSDFLSNFTFSCKKLSQDRNFTMTSTSDGNDSGDKLKSPKKSILHNDKFTSIPIASTSQSAPNLYSTTEIDKPAISKFVKQLTTSNTDSEVSSKEKTSSDTGLAKASSEELYQKYLAALRREHAYKQHLKDKEMFLKQKLRNFDAASNLPSRDAKVNLKLKDLIKDLTRNNYDDGSGDASKLEGGPNSNCDFNRFLPVRTQRSHSVFTLSSGNSESQNKKCNLKKRLQSNIKDLTKPGPSHEHYCCCPQHAGNKHSVMDSSVQVNIKTDSSNEELRSRNVSPRSGETSEGSPRNYVRGDSSKREPGGSLRSRNDSPRSRESPRKEQSGSSLRSRNDSPRSRESPRKEQSGSSLRSRNDSPRSRESPRKEQSGSSLRSRNDSPRSRESPKKEQSSSSLRSGNDSPRLRESPKKEQSGSCLRSRNDSPRSRELPKKEQSGSCLRSRNDSPRSRESPRKQSKSFPREIKCYCLCGTNRNKVDSGVINQSKIKSRHDDKNEETTSKKSCTSSTCSNKNIIIAISSDEIEKNRPNNDHTPPSKLSKSSQTNLLIKTLSRQSSENDSRLCSDELTKESSSLKEEVKTSPTYTKIYESTRCLQTEISINPKISEPTLSDVNIVTESSCAQLISEGCRQIKQPSITDIYSQDGVCSKSSGTSRNIGDLSNQCIPITDTEQSRPTSSHTISNTPAYTSAHTASLCSTEPNYKIPIEGTNKTLLVTIDSNEQNANNQNLVSTCVGTEVVPKNEQGTSLAEECSKGVQYEKVESDNVDRNISQNRQVPIRNSFATDAFVNNATCITYPRRATNERPPFRRSKTDPNALQRTFAETNISRECQCGCDKMNCNCEKSILTKKPESVKNNSKCSCGCKKDIEKCGKDCSERKLYESNKTDLLKCSCGCGKQNCTVKTCSNCDIKLPENKDKCSCGCSKNKGECGKSCTGCELKLILDNNDDPCPCGCGGNKKNCHNACLELPQPSDTALARKEVGVQKYSPRDTTKEIQVNMDDVEKFHSAPTVLRTEIKQMIKADDICTETQLDSRDNKQTTENNYEPPCGDPIIEKIQSITKRYAKKDLEKSKRRKCFKEIMNVLTYLLDTQDSSDRNDDDSGSGIGSCGETSDSNIKDSQKGTLRNAKNNRKQDNTPCGSPKNDRRKEKTPGGSCLKKDLKRENSPRLSPKKDKNREKTSCGSPKNDRNHETTPLEIPKKNRTKKIPPSGSTCQVATNESMEDSESNDMPNTKNSQVHSCEKPKILVEKGVQSCSDQRFKTRLQRTESSDFACSEIPGTSTDATTCKVLNKIKRECERYHQRRCKVHGKKCEGSSSTSVDCDCCRRAHYCSSRSHKCKAHKKCHHEKCSKKPIAYNLIIQTSDSMISEEKPFDNIQLKNVVVKVPSKKVLDKNLPFKEVEAKIESRMSKSNRNGLKCCRSRSMPNESDISSLDDIIRRSQGCTIQEYLENNRPDFVKNSTDRLHCLKFINRSRPEDQKICPSHLKMVVVHSPNCHGACNGGMKTNCVSCYNPCAHNEMRRIENQRAAKRDLLSMFVAQLSNVNELNSDEIRALAKEIGRHFRQKKPQKFISEREMKKHSEKIYKSLPEIVQKKEDAKKENEKKTNLLMASLFKKNLQEKTLHGSVNLSNYNRVIQI